MTTRPPAPPKTSRKTKGSAPPPAAAPDAPAPATPVAETTTDVLLQDWTPLGQSLDVRIGLAAWPQLAADLLADHRVPHLAHDSGAVSARSARVLFAWCREQQAAGALPDEVVLVELGIGTGLHLRYLLDAFRDLCTEAGADYYQRLVALGTDVSAATVRKALDRGLFTPHAGHVRLGFMDVNRPGLFGEIDSGAQLDLRGRVHVYMANYLLDLLAHDVFRRAPAGQDRGRWEAVLVRTWLRHPELLHAVTDLGLDDVRRLAQDGSPQACSQLAPLYDLLQLELRTWAIDLTNHPDLQEIERCADALEAALGPDHPLLAQGTVVNHTAGAMGATRALVAATAEAGFLLVRDVAMTTAEEAGSPRVHQKYGPTGAAGVNFFQLDGFFASPLGQGVQCVAPPQDGMRQQASRLFTRFDLPATIAEFRAAFEGEDMNRAGALAARARAEPDMVAAMEAYRQAVLLEPTNWHLLTDAARRALVHARRPDLALAIAVKGLQINTEFSADLWSVYGDAHAALGRPEEARAAYAQGLAVDPRSARLHHGAAALEAARGRYEAAFRHIGEALACDKAGDLRGDVLQLLDACLRAQAAAFRASQERLASRFLR
ncbi:MAG: tetratricopeptide repeat protein [Myxococcota bacterium]